MEEDKPRRSAASQDGERERNVVEGAASSRAQRRPEYQHSCAGTIN